MHLVVRSQPDWSVAFGGVLDISGSKKRKKIKERPTFGTQGTLKTEALACSW